MIGNTTVTSGTLNNLKKKPKPKPKLETLLEMLVSVENCWEWYWESCTTILHLHTFKYTGIAHLLTQLLKKETE